MAYNRQHLRISCTGLLGTGGGAGEERFSFGWHATGPVGFDAVDSLAGLDVPAIATRIGVYFNHADLHLHHDAHLHKVKFAACGLDGKYLDDPVEAEPVPGGISGADSAVRHPNQVACCVSTGTGSNIGLAKRGRFYLPLPADGITEAGKIDPGRAVLRADLSAELFTDLNVLMEAGTGDSANIVIMSQVGAGTTSGVTKVRCGVVLDTMRSRRNALSEDYSPYSAVV